MRGRMQRATTIGALLWLTGCGGGGDGETAPMMLEGDEAVQAVTSVVRSTVATLIGLRSESAPSTGDAASCIGGSVNGSCEVENRQSILRASFDHCRIPFGDGRVLTGDGGLRIQVNDQSTCVSGRVAAAAMAEIEFDDFSQILTDANGNELSRSRTDGTDRIMPSGAGCAGRNVMELFDGTIDAVTSNRLPGRLVAEGFDARIEMQVLQLDQSSSGTPCARVLTANGSMDVEDRANGLRFSQTLSAVTIRFLEQDEATLVEIDGDLVSGCLGSVTLATVAPIHLRNATDCPTAGTLRVTIADRISEIRYGAAGALSIDYTADGQFESVASDCRPIAECGL